ncbi:MAG: hypothetical protein M9907_11965 [Burkholderiaceae bacterium]|nr:hypothetical protein [Burkholderiaceae bacterium]
MNLPMKFPLFDPVDDVAPESLAAQARFAMARGDIPLSYRLWKKAMKNAGLPLDFFSRTERKPEEGLQ